MTVNAGIVVPVTGSRKPGPYLKNLNVSWGWGSETTLLLAAGECSDSTNTIDMVASADISLNSAIVGAGGMDKGVLANSTFYYIHLIASSAGIINPGVSAIISLSSTAPTLPYGYDASRLVGTVLTDGSAEFVDFYTLGSSSDKTFVHADPISITLPGSGSFPTDYTALSLATAVAPIDTYSNVAFEASVSPAGPGNGLSLSIDGTNEYSKLSASVISVPQYLDMSCVSTVITGAPTIYYKLDSASEAAVLLLVKSFTYSV